MNVIISPDSFHQTKDIWVRQRPPNEWCPFKTGIGGWLVQPLHPSYGNNGEWNQFDNLLTIEHIWFSPFDGGISEGTSYFSPQKLFGYVQNPFSGPLKKCSQACDFLGTAGPGPSSALKRVKNRSRRKNPTKNCRYLQSYINVYATISFGSCQFLSLTTGGQAFTDKELKMDQHGIGFVDCDHCGTWDILHDPGNNLP